jgi:hypothetical protein
VQKKQKKVTENAPAKKWFRVQRAPSKDCGFVVWKWKPLDELTEEEKERFFPKTAREIVTTSVQNDLSTPAKHESLQSQTPGSPSGVLTISNDDEYTQQISSHEATSTTVLLNPQTSTDIAINEPPMKRARIAPDATALQESLSKHQQHAFDGETQRASQAISMETVQGDYETRTHEGALASSTDQENESKPLSLPTETPIETASPMEQETGKADDLAIASSVTDQTAPVEEKTFTIPTSQTSDEAQTSIELELNNDSDLVPETQFGLASADQSTSSIPINTALSETNDSAPPQTEMMDAIESETQYLEAAQSDIVKQQNAESEAAAALSSLADIFACEPNAPETS